MSAMDSQPLVSIGMPVYNGERYLAGALQAILSQNYPNFELIISDNASSDRTQETCREFEGADSRIRYIRQPVNLGACENFALVAREARGEFFMWAAHDDLLHPSYVLKCVEKLHAHPEAVLCCTEINFIDVDGLPHSDWSRKNYRNLETLGMTPPQRIHELINRMGWFAIYGLIRRESVLRTSLGVNRYGIDVVMLEELLLMGDFARVDEPLFSYRMVKAKSAEDYQADFNSDTNPLPATKTPYTDLAVDLLQTVYRSPLPAGQKLEVFADMLSTLSLSNWGWREQITSELIGRGLSLHDPEFALLLATVLSRGLPLDAMKNNPLIEALCLIATRGKDLLQVAENLRTRPPAFASFEANRQEAVRLFGEQKFEEASKSFADALRLKQTSDLWNDWATARLLCNNLQEAEYGFRRALALDANNILAALKLGVLLANLERNAEAAEYLEQSASCMEEPGRTEVVQLLANCRAKLANTVGT